MAMQGSTGSNHSRAQFDCPARSLPSRKSAETPSPGSQRVGQSVNYPTHPVSVTPYEKTTVTITSDIVRIR
jgi:hypothetical protein